MLSGFVVIKSEKERVCAAVVASLVLSHLSADGLGLSSPSNQNRQVFGSGLNEYVCSLTL